MALAAFFALVVVLSVCARFLLLLRSTIFLSDIATRVDERDFTTDVTVERVFDSALVTGAGVSSLFASLLLLRLLFLSLVTSACFVVTSASPFVDFPFFLFFLWRLLPLLLTVGVAGALVGRLACGGALALLLVSSEAERDTFNFESVLTTSTTRKQNHSEESV